MSQTTDQIDAVVSALWLGVVAQQDAYREANGFYAKTNGSTAISCDGYIDELRVTKGAGSARYTAAFTPPTAPFPNG